MINFCNDANASVWKDWDEEEAERLAYQTEEDEADDVEGLSSLPSPVVTEDEQEAACEETGSVHVEARAESPKKISKAKLAEGAKAAKANAGKRMKQSATPTPATSAEAPAKDASTPVVAEDAKDKDDPVAVASGAPAQDARDEDAPVKVVSGDPAAQDAKDLEATQKDSPGAVASGAPSQDAKDLEARQKDAPGAVVSGAPPQGAKDLEAMQKDAPGAVVSGAPSGATQTDAPGAVVSGARAQDAKDLGATQNEAPGAVVSGAPPEDAKDLEAIRNSRLRCALPGPGGQGPGSYAERGSRSCLRRALKAKTRGPEELPRLRWMCLGFFVFDIVIDNNRMHVGLGFRV